VWRPQVTKTFFIVWCAFIGESFGRLRCQVVLRHLQQPKLLNLQVGLSLSGGAVMTKREIIADVSRRTSRSRTQTAKVVDEIFSSISRALSDGMDVKLRGFGTFCVTEKGLSMGKNPRTGQDMLIPARLLPVFKPSSALKTIISEE
jgi:nucleoid DNA-binding protein